MFRLRRRAQSTAEYAIVIALVIGAVVAMQVYVRRGLQGRMRDATDYLATQTPELGTQKQYEPQNLEREMKQKRFDPMREEAKTGGEVQRTILEDVTRPGWTGDLTGQVTKVGGISEESAYEKYDYNVTEGD